MLRLCILTTFLFSPCKIEAFVTRSHQTPRITLRHDKEICKRDVLFSNGDNDNFNSNSLKLDLTEGFLSNALLPAADTLDNLTGGWALSYADLSPESEETLFGRTFLATNLAYTAMGLLLTWRGDIWLGTITDIASVASFFYHYTQLSKKDDLVVRFTLMIDYIVAALCLGTAFSYILVDMSAIPVSAYVASGLSILFLFLSWLWEDAVPYCINHGLWHLLGGYGGYLIGQAHLHSS